MIKAVLICLALHHATPDPSLVKLVDDTAEKYKIPKILFHAMIMHESSYREDNVNPKDPSYGLGQLTPGTAWRKCKLPRYLIMDPYRNINCSALYLAEQLKRYHGNINKAVSAYNAGRYITGNWEHVKFVRMWIRRLKCKKGKLLMQLSRLSVDFPLRLKTGYYPMYEGEMIFRRQFLKKVGQLKSHSLQ